MKVVANTVWRAGLALVVREVATRPVSEGLRFSFCMFLGPCWRFACETVAVF